jgi:excisionase family DNA binding protein
MMARRLQGETLDIRATAEYLGTSEKTIRARIARGLLPYRRFGGRIIILRSELSNFLNTLEGVTGEQARANLAARSGEQGP